MATALVTGANRGIGLGLCRALAARGDEVIAACRTPSSELEATGVRTVAGVDVGDDDSVAALAKEVGDQKLDLLINNAGILQRGGLEELSFDQLRQHFEVNSLGPLRVTRALLPNLAEGATIGMMTSLMGSMADNGSGSYYAYRMSKAALNAASVSLARDLAGRGITVLVLHPGMVATEMTGNRGISVEESVAGLLARVDQSTLEQSGTFWHSDGRELPW